MRHSTHTREYQSFLRLLKELREDADVTQVELAKLLGISQSHLSKLERGELRIDVVQLRKICSVLGSSLPVFVKRWEEELETTKRKSK